MVKRWYFGQPQDWDVIEILEDPDGTYVDYYDYHLLEAREARLREVLRGTLKLSGFLASCARGGEALSEADEAWITEVGQKVHEVLSDASPTTRPPD